MLAKPKKSRHLIETLWRANRDSFAHKVHIRTEFNNCLCELWTDLIESECANVGESSVPGRCKSGIPRRTPDFWRQTHSPLFGI